MNFVNFILRQNIGEEGDPCEVAVRVLLPEGLQQGGGPNDITNSSQLNDENFSGNFCVIRAGVADRALFFVGSAGDVPLEMPAVKFDVLYVHVFKIQKGCSL